MSLVKLPKQPPFTQTQAFGGDPATDVRGLERYIGNVSRYLDSLRHAIETSVIRGDGVAWTPGLIANGATAQVTVAILGARLRMTALAALDTALPAGTFISAAVTASDVVTVTIGNLSGGGATPTAGNLRVDVIV